MTINKIFENIGTTICLQLYNEENLYAKQIPMRTPPPPEILKQIDIAVNASIKASLSADTLLQIPLQSMDTFIKNISGEQKYTKGLLNTSEGVDIVVTEDSSPTIAYTNANMQYLSTENILSIVYLSSQMWVITYQDGLTIMASDVYTKRKKNKQKEQEMETKVNIKEPSKETPVEQTTQTDDVTTAEVTDIVEEAPPIVSNKRKTPAEKAEEERLAYEAILSEFGTPKGMIQHIKDDLVKANKVITYLERAAKNAADPSKIADLKKRLALAEKKAKGFDELSATMVKLSS